MAKTKEVRRDVQYVPSQVVRVLRRNRQRRNFGMSINKSVVGDSIEIMMERIREGEDGENAIAERDLVYNDNETIDVNPITDIRSDKSELRLEEKIGEYEHRNRTMKVVKDEEKPKETEDKSVNEE